ncbi:hypothetical protein QIH36_27280, partial [Klebsiella pneumoniae]|nr:hypothetical protein [Klebsiella pneumoniae]
ETESRILELLEARRAKGGAALIATHSSALGLKASRVLEITDGRIAEVGERRPPALAVRTLERPWSPIVASRTKSASET